MNLILGLDIGTTKDAAVLFDGDTFRCIACTGIVHHADTGSGLQDPERHLNAVRKAVNGLPKALRKGVRGIGISTQMHGVVCWNEVPGATTPLYTWQSRTDGLEQLRRLPGCGRLRHGFGGATLGMLARSGELKQWTHYGTIGDYIVCHLTGTAEAMIDRGNAAGWGLMEFDGSGFDPKAVKALGIPADFLPEVVPPGAAAGKLCRQWSKQLGVPETVEVKAALGDNQASVLAAIRDPDQDISLTLGTGAQISVVVPNREAKRWKDRVELRPYFGETALAVGAPLCGGAVWTALMDFWKSGFAAAGENPDAETLFRMLDAAAERELESPDLPRFSPSFLGERNNPDARGELTGLTLENFTCGKVAAALARGIAENLRRMLPEELLAGKSRLAVSGNGFRRNASLCRATELVFGLPVVKPEFTEEAACGAAMAFLQTAGDPYSTVIR